jgi:Glycosyltransferase (GlcNAc)
MRPSRTSRSATTTSPTTKFGNAVDRPIIIALSVLVVIYTTITFATYYKVSDTNYDEAATVAAVFQNRVVDSMNDELQDKHATKHVRPIDIIQHMFPIHVGTDVETIVHPGLELSVSKNIPAGTPRTMIVPKFFDSSHGYYYHEDSDGNLPSDRDTQNYTIRSYLGDGETLMTPEQAASIGSYTTINGKEYETIYCSIASYRDPECKGTLDDLYARARFPERIRVAIVDQRVDGDSKCSEPIVPCAQDPEQNLCKYKHLIDVYEMDAILSVGPVFARHLAHRAYRGEYFAVSNKQKLSI